MSNEERQSPSGSRHSGRQDKHPSLSLEESNQNLSINANFSSGGSQNRMSISQPAVVIVREFGDTRASMPTALASHQEEVIGRGEESGSQSLSNPHSGQAIQRSRDRNREKSGDGTSNSVEGRHVQQTSQNAHAGDQLPNHLVQPIELPITTESSGRQKRRTTLLPVHREGRLGPIESDKMEEDGDPKFESHADTNQRSIQEYLSGPCRQPVKAVDQQLVWDFVLFCQEFYERDVMSKQDFEERIRPHINLLIPESMGTPIGDYMMTDGWFLLAYAKYLNLTNDKEQEYYKVNALSRNVKTHVDEFERVLEQGRITMSINLNLSTSEKRKKALRNSQVQAEKRQGERSVTGGPSSANADAGTSHAIKSKNGSEAKDLPPHKPGSQANNTESQTSVKRQQNSSPSSSGGERSKKKPVKREKRQRRTHKLTAPSEPLGMAYTHKVTGNNEIILVKRSLRKRSKRHSPPRSSSAKKKKEVSPSKKSLLDKGPKEIMKLIDKLEYKPQFPQIADDMTPFSQQDMRLHEMLTQRHSQSPESNSRSRNSPKKPSPIRKIKEETKKVTPPHPKKTKRQDNYSSNHKKQARHHSQQPQEEEAAVERNSNPLSQSRREKQHDKHINSKSRRPRHNRIERLEEEQEPEHVQEQEQHIERLDPRIFDPEAISKRREEFNKIKGVFAPPEDLDPVVWVVDPDVDNLGIYAVIKLDFYTAQVLGNQFALVQLPTFPRREIDIERYNLIKATKLRCLEIVDRQGIACFCHYKNIEQEIKWEKEKRNRQRKKSADNFKTKALYQQQQQENQISITSEARRRDAEYLNRPMNSRPSKRCNFRDLQFNYTPEGQLYEVIGPGCDPCRISKYHSKTKQKLVERALAYSRASGPLRKSILDVHASQLP